MKNISVMILLVSFLSACSSENIKEKVNEGGDAAGQMIGEFSSGVSSGVEKAMETKLEINTVKFKDLSFGKTTLEDHDGGSDNLLSVYTIFNKDFKGSITAKAFDNKGQEMGRAKIDVQGKKDETQYLEFHFDKRTNIDSDSKITLE